jgi:hypothetical protein
VCECQDCTLACKNNLGFLIPEDLARIATAIGLPMDGDEFVEWALNSLLASEGVYIQRDKYDTVQIPLLIPGTQDLQDLTDTRCQWYIDGKCKIHAVAPYGCAMLDTHMTDEQYRNRKTYAYGRLMQALAERSQYYFIWNELWFKEAEDGSFPNRRGPLPEFRVPKLDSNSQNEGVTDGGDDSTGRVTGRIEDTQASRNPG